MNKKEFFQTALDFLCELPNVSLDLIQAHWEPEYSKPQNLEKIYQRLCDSAQNQQMAPKVVGKSIGGVENLSGILFDFDPKKVADKYQPNDNLLLFKEIIEQLKPKGKLRATPRSVWPKFCRSIIDGAHFLSQFRNGQDFYSWANSIYEDEKTKNILPLMMSLEIKGMGIALISDFLKEIGFVNYGKPDVHIKEILVASNYLHERDLKSLRGAYKALKVMDDIAEENEVTAYAVDKTLWLIGSGNFYRNNQNTGNRKQEFIDKLK